MPERSPIKIGAEDRQRLHRLLALLRVGEHALPRSLVEARELLEAEGSLAAGGAPERHFRRLREEGSRAAHRIEEGEARPPARDPQDARGEVLLQRRFSHVVAPAALEQRLSAGVDVERAELLVEERVHAQVGIARLHRRAATGGAAEVVGDRVLHPQRHEVEAFHRAAMRVGLDLEGAIRGEERMPAHRVCIVVDVVFGLIGKLRHPPQDAARDARVQVHRVDQVERAGERHAGIGGLGVLRSELRQLLGEHAGEPPRAGCEEIMDARVLFNQDAGRGLGVGLAQKGLTMTRTTVAARINNGISLTQR